jgi:hypothetical protein
LRGVGARFRAQAAREVGSSAAPDDTIAVAVGVPKVSVRSLIIAPNGACGSPATLQIGARATSKQHRDRMYA